MKLMTMFTGRNARKGAVYDRTENERNAADQLVWMPESDLYNPPEACAMFMPDCEVDDEEYAMAA